MGSDESHFNVSLTVRDKVTRQCPQKPQGLLGIGKRGVWRWGEREIIYLSLHCHHQNDFCIKVGSDESHFNVSLTVRDKVTRQCPQKPQGLLGIGKRGVWRWGEREIIYLSLHCHHQNDFCIKVGSDESHFNVSLTVREKVTRQCPQTTTFEEKGEPKQIRTEAPPLTSLTPYR